MGLFNRKRTDGATFDGQGEERKGMLDRIEYNGLPDDLLWRYPYDNISTAARLVVQEGQEAVLMKEGAVYDVFGPGTTTLSTGNIPLLQKLINLPYGGNSPFTATVVYVNKNTRRNLKYGTPHPFDVQDPLYGMAIPVRSFGMFGVRITDSTLFLREMVGTQHLFSTEDVIEQFKGLIIRKLTSNVGKFIEQNKISVTRISAFLDELSNFVKKGIQEEFEAYGMQITNFDIESINFDKSNPNVQKIQDAESEAAKRRMEGYTYQQERQLDIMEGAANNEGGAGQMMGAGMGLRMGFGVGGAFGAAMGNIAGAAMGAQPAAQPPQSAVPPPPPPAMAVAYHVLINNVQQGPFDMNALQQMVAQGTLTRETYVWKAGMAQWDKAGNCAELQSLFGSVPPPPPVM